MSEDIRAQLGSRERQIIETVYRLGKATVAEVREALPNPPSYSAVRAMLNILESKGHLRHEQDGLKYVYLPVVARKNARASALQHLVSTFFNGSKIAAAAALLEMSGEEISPEEKEHLDALIKRAEKEGR
jgi:BlaI family transcriptional regulator, penicillinase repressor